MEVKAVWQETVELKVPFIRQQYWSRRHWWNWWWKQFYSFRSKEVMLSKDEHCYTAADCSPGLHQAHWPICSSCTVSNSFCSRACSSKLAISRSSITRSRRTQRKAIADEIQSSYASKTSLVVHWDGKLLPDDGKQNVDRLPDIVTDPWRTTKLLGTTKLPAGTGQAIANVIMECLEDWQSGNCQIILLGWTWDHVQ